MKYKSILFAAVAMASLAISAFAQNATPPPPPSNLYSGPAITGTTSIEFDTRRNLINTAIQPGFKDTYNVNLRARSVGFIGTIERLPNLRSDGFMKKLVQGGQLNYNLQTGIVTNKNPGAILKPTDMRMYGKIAGVVPLSEQNIYSMAGIPQSRLRFAINAVGNDPAFTGFFNGAIAGKQEKKVGFVWKPREVWSKVKGKDVKLTFKEPDPINDQGLVLGAGPRQTYPDTTVSGEFIYDRDTGSYSTASNGLRFSYIDPVSGRDTTDVVTGTMNFVEDPQRDSNGKSYYEVNLRWNDKPLDDAAAARTTVQLDDDAAATAAGTNEHSITGFITFTDTVPFVTVKGIKEECPVHTDSRYDLNATNLTNQQIVYFTKWLLAHMAPLNDE